MVTVYKSYISQFYFEDNCSSVDEEVYHDSVVQSAHQKWNFSIQELNFNPLPNNDCSFLSHKQC